MQPIQVIALSSQQNLALYIDRGQRYIIIDGFVIDATGGHNGIYITAATGFPDPQYIRVKNTEVKNAPSQGILGQGNGHEFLNLDVHHNGLPAPCHPGYVGQCHGIYFKGTNILVDGGKYYSNEGYGVHLYPYISNSIVQNVKEDRKNYRGFSLSAQVLGAQILTEFFPKCHLLAVNFKILVGWSG